MRALIAFGRAERVGKGGRVYEQGSGRAQPRAMSASGCHPPLGSVVSASRTAAVSELLKRGLECEDIGHHPVRSRQVLPDVRVLGLHSAQAIVPPYNIRSNTRGTTAGRRSPTFRKGCWSAIAGVRSA